MVTPRKISPSIAENSVVYTSNAITPKVNYGEIPSVLRDEFANAFTVTYRDAKMTAVSEIKNAGDYTVVFKVKEAYEGMYEFVENDLEFHVEPQTITIKWANDGLLTFADNLTNELVGYNKDSVDLLTVTEFTRSFFAYSPEHLNGYRDSEDVRLPEKQDFDEHGNCIYSVKKAGTYRIEITLKSTDDADNYVLKGADENGVVSTEFEVTSSTIDMTITVQQENIYNENASVGYSPRIQTEFEIAGWQDYLSRSDAQITEQQFEALRGITDAAQLSTAAKALTGLVYTTSAPVNTGYYLMRVIFFRETATGTIGAERFAVYKITPKTVNVAPVTQGDATVTYNAANQTFTARITDPVAIELYNTYAECITVLRGDEVFKTGADIERTIDEQTGDLIISFTAVDQGIYRLNFSLPANGNYVWNESTSSGGGSGTPSSGISGIVNGVYTCRYFIEEARIIIADEGDMQVKVPYGETENYESAILENIYARISEDFVSLEIYNIFFTKDGEYVTPNAVGPYTYNVSFVSNANYLLPSATGTLNITRKEVLVTVNVSQVFGQPITSRSFSFSYNGFVGTDTASGVLNIDFNEFDYTIEKAAGKQFLDVGTHSKILDVALDDLVEGESVQNIKGFRPIIVDGKALEDNYIYVFDKEHSTVTVTPLNITVTLGNLSAPYGGDIVLTGVSLTPSGNRIPEEYDASDPDALRRLLRIGFNVDAPADAPDAGNYPIHATSSNKNYNITFLGGIFTVTPISVTITIDMKDGVYGSSLAAAKLGSVSSTENAKLERGVIERSLVYVYTGTSLDGEPYESETIPTKAGNYTVTATINPRRTGNYTLIGTTSKVFTIGKMEIDVSGLSVADLVYDHGATLTPVVTDTVQGNDQYYTYDKQSFTDAGEYRITLKLKDTNNTQWPNATGNTYEISFTIGKAQNNISDLSIEGWTYGDAAHAPSASLIHNDGSEIGYEYSADGGNTWTTTVPTLAGSYVVRVSVAESKNYLAFKSNLVQAFSIAKRKLDVPTLGIYTEGDNKNDTYKGPTDVLLVSINGYKPETMQIGTSNPNENSTNGRLRIEGNNVTISAIDVGTYGVILTLVDPANYEWNGTSDTQVTLEWTVKPYVVTGPSENTDQFTVNGNILEYLPIDFDPATMVITGNETGYAGEFTVTVSLRDKANFTWADGSTGDITFSWKVEGVNGIYVGIVSALSVVAVAAAAMIAVQLVMNNNRKKREAAEMAARDAEANAASEDGGADDVATNDENEGKGE